MSKSVPVQRFATAWEAEVAQNLLAANGIKSTVMADDAGGMLFPLGQEVRLMVLEEDASLARQILENPPSAP